jgi:dTDP-4-dehydrorhamnose reductase
MFQDHPPQLIVHCAALSRSPVCQADPVWAQQVNVQATLHLAGLAAGIPFIFFSTDLVFDGRQGRYVESDPVNPLSVYGETKVRAEQGVLQNPRHTVVRTSLNGGASPGGNRSFNEEMMLAWKAGRELVLFDDEFRSPIPAAVTAQAVWELSQSGRCGLFHLAGAERLSRWEIGQLIAARHPEWQPRMRRGSLRCYDGPPRPPDTSLDCSRLQRLLSFPLPGFSAWLRDHPEAGF